MRLPPNRMHVRPASNAATDAQIEAASKLIDSFLRKAPLNPDTFTNPALHHHYSVLMAVAFANPVPAWEDSTQPDYDLIHEVRLCTNQRSAAALRQWNESLLVDDRTAPKPAPSKARPAPPFDPARDKELREMHETGVLGRVRTPTNQLLVADLRAACSHYGLPTSGRKNELLGQLGAYFTT